MLHSNILQIFMEEYIECAFDIIRDIIYSKSKSNDNQPHCN